MEVIFANIDKIYALSLLLISSTYLRFLLVLLKQDWIKTVAHTATLSLLPILTYIITNVISGNIALSLGMVGALSIVRFRNPVRSPLELSVYFGAITMGITAAVSLKWLVLLLLSVTAAGVFLYLVNKVSYFLTREEFFITSFSEGNPLSTLVISSSEKIESLSGSNYLVAQSIDKDIITYTFASSNFNYLRSLQNEVDSNHTIISSQLSK